jgi:Protein of unknown function (DUF3489)
VIQVVTAVIAAQGDYKMTTSSTKETETAQTTGVSAEPKASKKARVGARRAHVAPAKAKSGKKATPAKKSAPAPKKAAPAKAKGTRPGSKTAQIIDLLKRPGGATLQEIMKATEWQPHSVRGFISGTLGKKMGLSVESAKGEDGQRTYSLRA